MESLSHRPLQHQVGLALGLELIRLFSVIEKTVIPVSALFKDLAQHPPGLHIKGLTREFDFLIILTNF